MLGNRFNISIPLAASAVAIAITALVVMIYLVDITAAVLGGGTGDIEPDAALTKYVAKHTQEMETFADQFNGRSVFYIPPIKQPPRVYVPPTQDTGPVEVTIAPPKPDEPKEIIVIYAGPSPIFAIGEEVWFQPPRPKEPQMRLRVGETAHNVKLLSVTLPSFITVEFKGKEFELDLLGKQFRAGFGKNEKSELLKSATSDVGDEKPTPGIVAYDNSDDKNKANVPTADDQPSLTVSDIEQLNAAMRPQPMPSDIAFVIERPGEPEDVYTTPKTAPNNTKNAASQWFGPPIPAALLSLYTNASMVTPANDDDRVVDHDDHEDTIDDMMATSAVAEKTPLPPRDPDLEDKNAAGDDSQTKPESETGSKTAEQTPPEPVDPVIPPE